MIENIPVVFFVYRRPESAQRVFDRIKVAQPAVLVIVSDGPRNSMEHSLVEESRNIADQVDWACHVIKIYSDKNLGCKQRFFTALDFVFENFDRAIILEDDCIPTADFFSFCLWGLEEFADNPYVALISGSNLYPLDTDYRNGFSSYMNCWGWATWAKTWKSLNRYIGIRDIDSLRLEMSFNKFEAWEIRYWSEVIKHAIVSNSIWDFYVQYHMLVNSLYSVYPSFNLVQNVGFDSYATHTMGGAPKYVTASIPKDGSNIMSLTPLHEVSLSKLRDSRLARTIWSATPLMSWRLRVTNALRFFLT